MKRRVEKDCKAVKLVKSIFKIIGICVLVIFVSVTLFSSFRFTVFSVFGSLYGVFQKAPVNVVEPWNKITKEKSCSDYLWVSAPIENLNSIQIHSSNVFVSGSYSKNNSNYCEYNLHTGATQQTFQDPIFTSESNGMPIGIIPDCNNPDTATSNHPSIYYLISRKKIVAVQSSPAENSILWKLDVPVFDKNSDLENNHSSDGLFQYDDIIVYPICTYTTNPGRLWDVHLRAISKTTGKLVWERDLILQKDYSYLKTFGHESFKSDGICVYGLYPKELADNDQILYAYDMKTQSIAWTKRVNFGTMSVENFLRGDTLYTISTQLPNLFLGKVNFYGYHIPTGKIITNGVYCGIYGCDFIDKTENRLLTYESKSKQVFALHSFSKKPAWYAENVTGFSNVLADNTIALIMKNQYICHMNADTGEIIKYWDVKKILGENYSVNSIRYICETGYNELTVSKNGKLLLRVTSLSDEDQYEDSTKTQILAVSLE